MNISGRLCLANLSSHMKLRPFVINRTAFSSCGQSESTTKLACHHRIRSHCQLLHRRLVQHCRSLHIVKLCELSTTYIVLELCADSIYVLDIIYRLSAEVLFIRVINYFGGSFQSKVLYRFGFLKEF